MRVMFAGSPAVALPALVSLHESTHEIVGVLSRAPRPVGRKRVITSTAVATRTHELGLPLKTPTSDQEILAAVEQWKPDVAVVVAYGRLLSPEVIASVPHGWWNVHFSVLPRWRGAAPVQHALLAGDETTGVTIFRIDHGLDTGEVAETARLQLTGRETAGEVLESLALLSVEPLMATLNGLESGALTLSPQVGEVSVAPKPGPNFGQLAWSESASEISRRIRAATPEPGAFTTRLDTRQRVVVLKAVPCSEPSGLTPGELDGSTGKVIVGTGDGGLELLTVHPSGKRAMGALDWFRGLPPGVILGG